MKAIFRLKALDRVNPNSVYPLNCLLFYLREGKIVNSPEERTLLSFNEIAKAFSPLERARGGEDLILNKFSPLLCKKTGGEDYILYKLSPLLYSNNLEGRGLCS